VQGLATADKMVALARRADADALPPLLWARPAPDLPSPDSPGAAYRAAAWAVGAAACEADDFAGLDWPGSVALARGGFGVLLVGLGQVEGATLERLAEDARRLEAAAAEGGWNEGTAVPTDFFDQGGAA
jgi:hypothetical protein